MILQPKITLPEHTSRQELSQTCNSFLNYQPEQVERLAHSDKVDIKKILTQTADAELAEARINDLSPKAKQCNPFQKKLIKMILTFVGAVTFSVAPQLLASGTARGPLAFSAGILGGAAATYFVDDLGVKAITKKRRRHNSQQAWESLEEQYTSHHSQSELVGFFYNEQKIRFLQIEGENLRTEFKADLIVSVLLSIVEGGTAFWLILPGGVVLALLAACFPVALTWAAVLYQSEYFDFPEDCANILEKYEPLLLSAEVTETEVRQIQSLDYSFKYVAEGDVTGRIKNLSMARAYFEINYANKKLQQLPKLYIDEINQRQLELRQQILKLEEQWVKPKMNIAGHAPTEEEYHQDKQEKQKNAWIAIRTRELEAAYQEDIEMIKLKFKQQYMEWQQEKTHAEEIFESGFGWR
ncbi:MAG: hypothetical protein KI793_21350 [Rivularia sp. (in: Bacteria)]|nr:hypothetical protein [Rivularia sp. MS3]